jgi:hypothetical protein
LSVVQEELGASELLLGVDKLKDVGTMTEESPGKELTSVQVTQNSVAKHLARLKLQLLQERFTSLQLIISCT